VRTSHTCACCCLPSALLAHNLLTVLIFSQVHDPSELSTICVWCAREIRAGSSVCVCASVLCRPNYTVKHSSTACYQAQ
jgi:hypothetical protein